MLALPVLESFVAKLDATGMLESSPQDRVYSQLSAHFSGEGLAGRMRWMRQTFFYRRIPIAGFGSLISRSYQLVGRWCYTTTAAVVMMVLSIAGVISYVRIGVVKPADVVRWQLAVGGLLALATIVVHEFAHGWTVRHFGRDVHRAGVFLMYGLPGAFVDTTDMWLGTKRQRLWVTAAGPISNVVMGGALVLIGTTHPGTRGLWLTAAAGSYAFVGANLLPLLKLDGYYLLMDALGVADLRERGIVFATAQLRPRWREAWRRGELLPKLTREERLLAGYGSVALAFMVFLGASSLLVMPHRIERTISRARNGELRGVPLVILGSMTVLGLTVFVLNLIASRAQLRLVFERAARSLSAKSAVPLLFIHAGLAGALAWLVPAIAGRRDAAAGSEWTRLGAAVAGVIVIRCAWRLHCLTRELAVRWLFAALMIHGVSCTVAAWFERARSFATASGITVMILLFVTAPYWSRTRAGTVGGAWILTIVGTAATLVGRGAPLRTGLCLLAGGTVLARLLWIHVPERVNGIVDLPANARFDDVRDVRHLSRFTAFVAESVLTRATDVLGDNVRAELVFAFNARVAGRIDVWFTADGKLSDRTTGGCAERGPLYSQALAELTAIVASRLGRSFADDGMTAAVLDLPDRAQEMFAAQVLSRSASPDAGELIAESRGTLGTHDARRLSTRHFTDFTLQAARRVFGGHVVESVVRQVNATSPVGASLWLRGNGRLAVHDDALSASDANNFLSRLLGTLTAYTGAAWTRTTVQVAHDALPWQLREQTANDHIVPLVWDRRAPYGVPAQSPVVTRSATPVERRRATPIDTRTGHAAVRTDTQVHEHTATAFAVDRAPVRRRASALPTLTEIPPNQGLATPTGTGRSGALSINPQKGAPAVLVIPVVVGFVGAVLLGAYGRLHAPTGQSDWHPFFSRMITYKSWSATAALFSAMFQVGTGMIVHRRTDPRATSSLLASWHRLSGFCAFILTLPVAFHCLWALGFAPSIGLNRRFVHSVAGCLLYGGYATKVLTVSRRGRPRWALPVIGSALFVAFAVVTATSAGWFFRTQGFQW